MAQGGKLTPNLDQQSTKLLNLTVLQRIDPFIEEILMTAAHVTFYEFNIDSNQWGRKDVEGSLFVVKRNTQPRFQFIVMNRRNTDNLVENLLGDFEFEIQVPYLLYRNASQEVNGIWFYNSRECEEIANLLSRIYHLSKAKEMIRFNCGRLLNFDAMLASVSYGAMEEPVILSAYSKVPSKPQVSPSKSEFEELEAVPTMAVMDGPLEPASTSSAARDVPEDSSFVNFFGAAMNITSNASNVANRGQTYHTPNAALSSHAPSVAPSPTPTLQLPSLPLSASSTTSMPLHAFPDPVSNSSRVANLVKPSSFFTPSPPSSVLMPPPISSSTPGSAPAPLGLQRPHGTPMLQPFPPPTPPPSLTPSSIPTPTYGPVINRDKVRDALLMLAQDNQFIDMLYQALMKVHQL